MLAVIVALFSFWAIAPGFVVRCVDRPFTLPSSYAVRFTRRFRYLNVVLPEACAVEQGAVHGSHYPLDPEQLLYLLDCG